MVAAPVIGQHLRPESQLVSLRRSMRWQSLTWQGAPVLGDSSSPLNRSALDHDATRNLRETAVNNRLGPRPPVANGRLRYMLIGDARVLKSGWLPVAGPAARRPAGRGRRRRPRLPVLLDPMWWVAARGTRLSRKARSSHRPALVSLGYRSGSDQARWQPVVFRAGELNEDRASRAVDPCEHLLHEAGRHHRPSRARTRREFAH